MDRLQRILTIPLTVCHVELSKKRLIIQYPWGIAGSLTVQIQQAQEPYITKMATDPAVIRRLPPQ